MDVSVIIINYNTFELTCKCVASVLKYTQRVSYEVIVLDNASAAFDAAHFTSMFPGVNLILNKENLGFAKGNNIGIKHARGRFILLLNSDAYLKSDAISDLADYLDRHPEAAVVSPRLIYPDGTHQAVCQRFPSARYQLVEVLRIQKMLPEETGGKLLLGAFFNHKVDAKPDWVWGTCFMFKKHLLKQLPGKKLDEAFFMYCEDMQWCWDFRKLGFEIHYYAAVEVVHLLEGSSGNKNGMMQNNMKSFLKRNYSPVHQNVIYYLNALLRLKKGS